MNYQPCSRVNNCRPLFPLCPQSFEIFIYYPWHIPSLISPDEMITYIEILQVRIFQRLGDWYYSLVYFTYSAYYYRHIAFSENFVSFYSFLLHDHDETRTQNPLIHCRKPRRIHFRIHCRKPKRTIIFPTSIQRFQSLILINTMIHICARFSCSLWDF